MTLRAVLLLILLPAFPALAQMPSLEVQTADGQTTFHMGEPIVLNLTIATPADHVFVAASWESERGGEFDLDSVTVTPATGWSDPFALYFRQGIVSGTHGWRWPWLEQAKPVHVSLLVNEWVRFEQPGDYTVTVTTHRAYRAFGKNDEPSPSASVNVHIVAATPEWQAARLAELRAKLPVDDPAKVDPKALTAIEYLGTPDAVDLLTRLMRNSGWFVAQYAGKGLEGLSDALRPVALQSMDTRIGEPDFPVGSEFFETFAFLGVKSGSERDGIAAQKAANRTALWTKVFASLGQKDEQARAQTVQTLIRYGRTMQSPEIQAQMGSLLSSAFLNLEWRDQIEDLRQHWDMLRSPAFVPTLEKLAKASGPESSPELRAVAFRRWFDLDPAGARAEALRQIGTASPTLPAQALPFLTDRALPQFEAIWTKAFAEIRDPMIERYLGSLLVRFGTGAATPRAIAWLDASSGFYTFDCARHTYALAYLAKFSPMQAGPRLRHEIATNAGTCGGSLFRGIASLTNAPILNEVALEALDNADEMVVIDAIRYLTAYGRPADKAALVRRYMHWTPDWQHYPWYFQKPLDGSQPADPGNSMLGEELGTAVIANQGWLADQALIDRVMARCAGPGMCDTLRNLQRRSEKPYVLVLWDASELQGYDSPMSFPLAQYNPLSFELLDAKLRQFPRGTKFALQRLPGDDKFDDAILEERVRKLFRERGMILQDPAQKSATAQAAARAPATGPAMAAAR